jgi:hypothetical protein
MQTDILVAQSKTFLFDASPELEIHIRREGSYVEN